MNDKPKELTAAQKAAQKTGACAAIECSFGCAAFAYTSVKDGFKTCVCGHTQHAHTRGARA